MPKYGRILIYGLYLFPFIFITGPFLSDLFVVLVGTYGLINFFKRRDFQLLQNYPLFALSFFSLYILGLSFLLSENLYSSLEVSLFYFRYVFFIIGMIYLLENIKIIAAIKCYVVFLFFIFFDMVFQKLVGFNIIGIESGDKTRITSFLGEEQIIGCLILNVLILIIILNKKINFRTIYFEISIISISLIMIFLSGERSTLTLFIIFLFFYILKVEIFFRYKIIIGLLFVLLSSFIISIDENIKSRFINTTINQIFDTKADDLIILDSKLKFEQITLFSNAHFQHINTAINIFKENKFFGQGPNSFRNLCHKKEYNTGPRSCSTHPHNTYVELLSDTGLFGFILIFSIFIYISFLLIKYLRDKKYNFYLILVSIFINLFPLLPTKSFYNNWSNIFIYIFISYFIYNQNKCKKY